MTATQVVESALLVNKVAEQIHELIAQDRAGDLGELTFSDYSGVVDAVAMNIVQEVREAIA